MTKKAMVRIIQRRLSYHIYKFTMNFDLSIKMIEAEKIKEIMESAVELEVPNKVDYESWDQIGVQ